VTICTPEAENAKWLLLPPTPNSLHLQLTLLRPIDLETFNYYFGTTLIQRIFEDIYRLTERIWI